MGFFDSLDGNVNEIMENLNYLKKKIVSESQEIKKTARLKYEILNEERKLSELFEALGRHEYNILKEIKSDLDVDETLREIERHKARLSSLRMGLDASYSSGTIFKSDSKKDLDKNFQKSDFSGLYVEKDIEENNLERDEGSIIFIEEDEDENR
ncbi:hypothetical protein [uncultured Peptoniphilus sp.]|uniref:hypothetical protein n=1 Tax=uncultured Peptoniphilus sp. TaxID=254354 RepID=UPI00258FDDFD|nr:hypothetical protein [uncultured Peptoniphilus sp.]MDU6783722.1 hypothetical protein [Peptoniphilus harei]